MDFPLQCSANKVNNVLYIGKRHFNCFASMAESGVSKIGAIQGFIDTNGIFYDRYQALEVAKKFSQIIVKHNPQDQLMSEDIWVD